MQPYNGMIASYSIFGDQAGLPRKKIRMYTMSKIFVKKVNTKPIINSAVIPMSLLIEWSIHYSYVPFEWLSWCFTVQSSPWSENLIGFINQSNWISLDGLGGSFERFKRGVVGAHNC